MTVRQLGRVPPGKPEGEERGNGTEETLETIMTAGLAEFMSESQLQIGGPQRTPRGINAQTKTQTTLTWACHF